MQRLVGRRKIGLLPILESYRATSSVFPVSPVLHLLCTVVWRSTPLSPSIPVWHQFLFSEHRAFCWPWIPDWRGNSSHWIYTTVSKCRDLQNSYNNFCFLARIQNLDANDKRPEQETDIISQESSVRSSTPRKNGSVLNFESPVSKGTRIQTISQSVPQAVPSTDVVRPANATPTTSTSLTPAPSVSSVQKPRNDHITNR